MRQLSNLVDRLPRTHEMDTAQSQQAQPGALHWRLSSHPITLITFLAFRICTLSSEMDGDEALALPLPT